MQSAGAHVHENEKTKFNRHNGDTAIDKPS